MRTTDDILLAARKEKRFVLTEEQKNSALLAMADSLEASSQAILDANKLDVDNTRGSISAVMIDRLTLTAQRIKDMADGVRAVVKLPDPVGKVIRRIDRPNGLIIEKTSVALGVVAIIYESRPNVTSDAAALALKSGNVCILRGGKEAFRTSKAIVDALRGGLKSVGVSEDRILMLEDTSHDGANRLMTADDTVDLLIPRGGKGLISACVRNATVPCIQTGTGICHIYVDESADLEKAVNIIENAKASRPSVCNAEEVCLVHKGIAEKFLPMLQKRLVTDRADNGLKSVELRLDKRALGIISGTPATETDFDTEFLDYILAVGIVDSVSEAIDRIAAHSTHHSEAIITESSENASLFTTMVDSAAVYVNASTRFTDGGEFGLGCEMGISTQKLHARGPMGLEELTTYKYIIRGNGQTR